MLPTAVMSLDDAGSRWKHRGLRVLLVSMLVSGAACTDEPCVQPCPDSEACVFGQCRSRCDDDASCATGFICSRGYCAVGNRRPDCGTWYGLADGATVSDFGSNCVLGQPEPGPGGISNSAGTSQHTSVAATSNGNVAVAWLEGDHVFVKLWDGQIWRELDGSASDTGISDPGESAKSEEPIIAASANGVLAVAWVQTSGRLKQVFLRRWDPGTTKWEELDGSATGGGVSRTLGMSKSPTVALTASEEPVVAWQDNSSGTEQIYLRSFDGQRWQELDASATGPGISQSSNGAKDPALATDLQGLMVVVWQEDGPNGAAIYLRRSTEDGWEELAGSATDRGVSPMDGNAATPAVVTGPDQDPIVVWNHDVLGIGQIYGVRFFAGTWRAYGQSVTAGGISQSTDGATTPSVSLTANGEPVVAWVEAHDVAGVMVHDIYLRHWNGSDWTELSGSAQQGGVSNSLEDSTDPSVCAGRHVCVSWVEDLEVLLRCHD